MVARFDRVRSGHSEFRRTQGTDACSILSVQVSKPIHPVYVTSGIITLTTDFGSSDGYVAAMKGVMLGLAPDVRLVDISNDIAPQDVMGGAFVLRNVWWHFPIGTIHLAVVDPGVGTTRRAIAMRYRGHTFVGPDNGLFSLVLSGDEPEHVVLLDKSRFWGTPTPSPTFHGRDIFGPVAARMSAGLSMTAAGTPVDSVMRMHWALPISDDEGTQGWVVHVDRFGNCVTNISAQELESRRRGRPVKCYAGNAIIPSFSATYADVSPGDTTLLINSNGLVEIAINNGNASEMLNIHKGAPVNVLFSDDKS